MCFFSIRIAEPGKEKIIVNSVKNDKTLIASFTDFGIGIPEEKISKIFDRFYRVDEVSKDFSGLGIGLFISSEIIKQHGGKIWAESMEGKGSTFYFSLPVIALPLYESAFAQFSFFH